MTFDQCHQILVAIRRRQGTRFPLIRVHAGGEVYRGRLARCDSDPEHRARLQEQEGSLVLEPIGRGRSPIARITIGEIPEQGIQPLD